MASPNLTDLVVTTARKFESDIADNVSNDNGLLSYLKEKGRIQKYRGGGRTVVEPFIYGTNASAQWYDGYDTFTPPTTQEVFDGSEWNWKQLGAFISVSGKEKRINRGPEQRSEFAKVRIQQVTAQLQNTFATALYSAGTGSGGKELGGVQLIVADSPGSAGTVGGINQATYSWWRNYSSGSVTISATNIFSKMNAAWLNIKRGKDVPDLWVADDDMFTYYWEALQDIQRITSASSADAGYGRLKYKGSDVIFDDQCPDKHMYALNLDHITLRTIDDRMFEVGDARTIANADYDVIPVFTMATMTTGRRASHGVLIDD